jgi:CMP-N,N'-diacetyllegionaminic acid synthase
MEVLSIIPARGGSKSIPLKNLRMFNGKPLLSWTILDANKSNVNRVIVSTDSVEIADIARQYGAEVPFIRPKNISKDTDGIEIALVHALNFLKENEGYCPDYVALLVPTAPFRKVMDINDAISLGERKMPDSVVSVSRAIANHNPHWMLVKDEAGVVTQFTGGLLRDMYVRRQDIPEVYIRNDFIFLIRPKNLYEEKPSIYGDNVEFIIAKDDRYDVDINSEKDWKIAELLFRNL